MTDTQTAPEVKVEIAPPAQVPAIPPDKHAEVAERKQRNRTTKCVNCGARTREGSISNLVSAIADVTAEVGVVAKAGFNQFHRYKFAQMQDVLQKLTPLLAKHGIVIMQDEVEKKFLDNGAAVAVTYEFLISHRSGETWPDSLRQTGLSRCRDNKGGFDDKSFNKAHTAARKYFLLSLFQIATGEEDDADEDRGKGRPPPEPTPNMIQHSRESIDQETGEVIQTGTPPSSPAPAAVKVTPSAAAGPPAADLSKEKIEEIKQQARHYAKSGKSAVLHYYYTLPETEREVIRKMRTELDKIYPQ